MPDEKVSNILLSKFGMTQEELATLSNHEAWSVVDKTTRENKKKIDKISSVCFTGIIDEEKFFLSKFSNHVGLRVVESVSPITSILCCGEHPGSTKIQKAKEFGCNIISLKEFSETFSVPLIDMRKFKINRDIEFHQKIDEHLFGFFEKGWLAKRNYFSFSLVGKKKAGANNKTLAGKLRLFIPRDLEAFSIFHYIKVPIDEINKRHVYEVNSIWSSGRCFDELDKALSYFVEEVRKKDPLNIAWETLKEKQS